MATKVKKIQKQVFGIKHKFKINIGKSVINENIFKDYISTNSSDEDIQNILGSLEGKTVEELKEILKFRMNPYFKDFIRSARESKLKIQSRQTEISNNLANDFSEYKAKKEAIFNKDTKKIREQIEDIETSISRSSDKVRKIRESLNETVDKDSEQIILIENKNINAKDSKDLTLAYQAKQKKDKKKAITDIELTKFNLTSLENDVEEFKEKKNKLIEELNAKISDFTIDIDDKYIEKEKTLSDYDIQVTEAFIWIRNSLIALNRIIRNIKIKMSLMMIEGRWNSVDASFDEINEVVERVQNEFKLFDQLGDVEANIDVSQSIDTNTRIIDLKTIETFDI